MEKLISHSGIVTAVEPNKVTAKMHVVSACQSCEAHSKCGFAEAKDKLVVVDTKDWKEYHEGDNVTIIIHSGNGFAAVLIAYIVPAIVLLGAFAVFYSMHLSEGITGLLTLAVVSIYGFVLYLFRNKLQKRFTFQIKK